MSIHHVQEMYSDVSTAISAGSSIATDPTESEPRTRVAFTSRDLQYEKMREDAEATRHAGPAHRWEVRQGGC